MGKGSKRIWKDKKPEGSFEEDKIPKFKEKIGATWNPLFAIIGPAKCAGAEGGGAVLQIGCWSEWEGINIGSDGQQEQ